MAKLWKDNLGRLELQLWMQSLLLGLHSKYWVSQQVCTRPRKSARVFTSLIWKATPGGIPSTLTLAQDFDKLEQGLTS